MRPVGLEAAPAPNPVDPAENPKLPVVPVVVVPSPVPKVKVAAKHNTKRVYNFLVSKD